ncbi:MAG: hypothetical protein Q4P07_10315 [Ornithinimicrobium sp.]|uniref:hypothetical protein n=1 Tax=Ornithinimicrobium sp. TaxID=1977084 RepID=UPI0026E0308D|nr:hypothetical protein [Ornithinimicrobium sp.]MDO5740528.1 hypothetical protein [Ornithinimicrobium sp.]
MTAAPDPRPDDPEDLDRRFREIVAAYQLEEPTTGSQRPTSDDDSSTRPREGRLGQEPTAPREKPPAPREELPAPRSMGHLGTGTPPGMATDHRSYEPPEDPDEDHFIPPPTPPLPVGDLHFWGIVIGLAGGPLLLFLSAVIPLLGSTWAFVGAVLLTGGFILLILRLPRHRNHDDWGAQV